MTSYSSEDEFVAALKKELPIYEDSLVVGIGDDAAVIRLKDHYLLVTTDIFIERIHFKRDHIKAEDLGYKAMAVNISDIAAMGAIPKYAFISIGIPPERGSGYLDAIYKGILDACTRFKITIAGGDTSLSSKEIVINVTLMGEMSESPITRRGAKEGDILMVSGKLGSAKAGLVILEKGYCIEEYSSLINSLNRPIPRVSLGRYLAIQRKATSMIDISDGLAIDIYRLCDAGGVGAIIDSASIPIAEDTISLSKKLDVDPLDWSLYGGDDYELLFTCNSKDADFLIVDVEKSIGLKLYKIGYITQEKEIFLLEKRSKKMLSKRGYDHIAQLKKNIDKY